MNLLLAIGEVIIDWNTSKYLVPWIHNDALKKIILVTFGGYWETGSLLWKMAKKESSIYPSFPVWTVI